MLGASGRVQTSWLSALKYNGPEDLLSLFETADSRPAAKTSIHNKIRHELVAAQEAVNNAESGGLALVCADNTVICESPGHDLEAAQLVLDVARRSLLQLPEGEQAKVMKRANTELVSRTRHAQQTATVRYARYKFTVRWPNGFVLVYLLV